MADENASAPDSGVPPLSRLERITDQFYAWERRGRGWQVWPYPVVLEPPFRPFQYHWVPVAPPTDDARKPTPLSRLIDGVRRRVTGKSETQLDSGDFEIEIEEPEADVDDDDSPLVEVAVSVPPETVVTRETAEQFLLSLSTCPGPIAYELIGTPHSVSAQFTCRQVDQPHLSGQLRAHFPKAVQTQASGLQAFLLDDGSSDQTLVVEFGLSHEFMLPLRVARSFDPDPLVAVIGALSDVREGELAVLQILFRAVRHPWAESIRRAVTDGEGGAFFLDAPELVAFTKEKLSRPLFAAVVRIAARSPSPDRAWDLARMLGASFAQFGSPASNELIPLSNDSSIEIDPNVVVLARVTHRSGSLLNCSELASLVHLPSASVRSEQLKREVKKTKAAPALVTGHRMVLGENYHAGRTTSVTLNPEQRLRHTYVIGASGTGKSTLLLNLITQDMGNGEGIAVLDPHGDLIDDIIGRVPENRLDDVVLLDASDAEFPIGFNILSAHSDLERSLLSSDLVAIFRRLSTSWGDQMTSVLGNAVLAFLESTEGGTLSDLRRFLVEKDFRERFLGSVRDTEVVYYWQREFPLLVGRPQAPLLTRLDAFLRPKPIRYMVSQKENRINFRTIMDEGKIFLVKLTQGAIGEENAYLLGSLLVSRFHQTAMSRQETGERKRRDFYLYIDEFQNFITPSMATILSAARKYHLGLILAHQELRQLSSRSEEVASAVLANPATRVCFRVGDQDAKRLESGFSFFEAADMQNLGVGEAICRVDRAEYDFNLTTPPSTRVDAEIAQRRSEQVITLSRRKYGRPRQEVEAELSPRGGTIEEVATLAPTVERPIPQRAASVATETRRTPKVETPPDRPMATPGRGGAEHKYLQQLIKRWAEAKGFRATIEKPILDGMGSVDIALEKGDLSVACEISVTTTPEHEIGNLQKCIAAGFSFVVAIATDRKALTVLAQAAQDLTATERERIQFLLPEELFAFLEEQDLAAKSDGETVRGYKVRVKYKPVGAEDQRVRKQAIAKTILKALTKIKGKK